jgi:acetylglutamate kinase
MKPEDVDFLRKALPYINRFKGKTFVVKIGRNAARPGPFCEEVALLVQVGIRVVVVQGGDGTVEILSGLRRSGIRAVGLSGLDGNLITVAKGPEVDAQVLVTLLDGGFVPVVTPRGADEKGNVTPLDPDTIAALIARTLRAEKLIFVSSVEGIHGAGGKELISRIHQLQVEPLMQSGAITGSMIRKMQASLAALREGVGSVHVIGGAKPSALLIEIFTDEGCGTMLTRDP